MIDYRVHLASDVVTTPSKKGNGELRAENLTQSLQLDAGVEMGLLKSYIEQLQ